MQTIRGTSIENLKLMECQIATVLVSEFMSKRRQVTFPTFYIYSGFPIKAAEKSSTKSTSLCCLLNEM